MSLHIKLEMNHDLRYVCTMTLPLLKGRLALKLIILLSCYVFVQNQFAWAAKMYKWVDSDGNISYQDKPPPKNGKLIDTIEIANTTAASQAPPKNQDLDPVIAYTIANCADCVQLMSFLKKSDIPVVELSLQDRDIQSRILSLSGRISAPTLFIGDSIAADLTETALVKTLRQAGYSISDSSNSPVNEEADLPSDEESPEPSVSTQTDSLRSGVEKRIDEIRNRKSAFESIKIE